MTKISWIGLGVMGYPMAGHLLEKGGHELCVYNRTEARAEQWVNAFGAGRVAKTPKEAAQDAQFIFTCVGNDDDLRSVTTGPDGAFHALKPSAIFVDHTTASAEVARELTAAAQSKSAQFLDAPVSGGQSGAENGVLTVMVGGDGAAFNQVKPVIEAYARTINLIGPAGAGQQAKMVNQIAICGLLQGLSEAIHFGQCAGLDIEKVIATISKGAAQSWQMENRWQTMANGEFDFGFAVDWMRKDLAICLSEGQRHGAELPVTKLVDQFYADVQELGGNRWDTSSLIARLRNRAAPA